MLTEEELQEVGIHQWHELQKEFQAADLLLGNGFSIKLASQFNYVSLFDKFLAGCDAAAKALFQGLNTSNFEDIQRILLNAKRVAELLGSPLAGIDGYVKMLREGLIKTIHESHPRAAEIDKAKLEALSKQFDFFGDVFTTNYDLFLYHIVMICKDRNEKDPAARPYNDYFWNRLNGFLQFMTYQEYSKYKHAYYLHGALFIFPEEEPGQRERKLRRGDDWELLDTIDSMIRSGRLPLFVTEGSSAQKVRAIGNSLYLRFVQEKLAKARDVMVIYGCAFGETDRHIVTELDAKHRSLAVSIHVDDKSRETVEAEVKGIQAKLAKHRVVVFDSRALF